MRSPARRRDARGIVIAALMLGIAAIPLIFAITHSPPHWRVTSGSVWGGK